MAEEANYSPVASSMPAMAESKEPQHDTDYNQLAAIGSASSIPMDGEGGFEQSPHPAGHLRVKNTASSSSLDVPNFGSRYLVPAKTGDAPSRQSLWRGSGSRRSAKTLQLKQQNLKLRYWSLIHLLVPYPRFMMTRSSKMERSRSMPKRWFNDCVHVVLSLHRMFRACQAGI